MNVARKKNQEVENKKYALENKKKEQWERKAMKNKKVALKKGKKQ